jgi:Na+-driven multidrug efflux pump
VAIFPLAWVGLFSNDTAVLEAGTTYLHIVGPFYSLLAAGIALYFASQGAGQMLRPVLAGTTRLAIVLVGGALVASLPAIFAVVALGITLSAALLMWFVGRARW